MTTPEIVSRSEAKARGLTQYFTGAACKNGHIAPRTLSNGTCHVCQATKSRDWRASNPEKLRKAVADWEARNPDAVAESRRKWKRRNPEKVRAAVRRRQKRKPEIRRALKARRRARKLNATPAWLTPEHHAQIAAIYAEALRLTKETGVLHHVDHIIPLQGKLVCGLHVPWNLQPIPANDNIAKSNKFDPYAA